MQSNVHQKVLKVRVLVAAVFITFTLPYTLTHLIIGKVPAWAINSVLCYYPTHLINVALRFKGLKEKFVEI